MEKMSLLSVLLVSIPEQLLMTITTILIVGRKDLLKISLSNIMRMAVVTLVNTLFVVSLRYSSPSLLLNITLDIAFAIVIYVFVLKIRWYETLVATLLVYLEFIIIELIVSAVLMTVSGLQADYIMQSDLLRAAFTMPIRLLQLLVAVLLFKLPLIIIDFRPLRLTTEAAKKFSLLALCLFIGVMIIVNTVSLAVFDLKLDNKIITSLFLNIVFVLGLITTLFLTLYRYRKTSDKEKIEYLHTLLCIKSLLHDDSHDIIKVREIIKSETNRLER